MFLPVIVVVIALLFSVFTSVISENADPKFLGANITHHAIVASDIKTQKVGPFEIIPAGEHSIVFAFDHKKFAKITADERNFALVINPANVPAKYKRVTKVEGNFESNIQDGKDIPLSK